MCRQRCGQLYGHREGLLIMYQIDFGKRSHVHFIGIGGTSMSGGRGKIYGTLIGVLIIAVLNNGLNILGVSSYYQDVIKGLVILIAVLSDRKR